MNTITRAGRDTGGYGKRRSVTGPPLFFACMLLLFCSTGRAQEKWLADSVKQIAASAGDGALVGVAVFQPGTAHRFEFNGDGHFPMMSVFKFPLAMYILDQVDKGKISLDQMIHIGWKDWDTLTHSPMRDKYQRQDADISVREMLGFTVSQGDNVGCDLLFRLAGGCAVVNDYIHRIGVADIHIAATEAEMNSTWEKQYDNWCTPVAMLDLLWRFSSGKCLSAASNSLLKSMMTGSTTGGARIRGLLPPGTVVAHKTGLSNTNAAGLTAATNDVGIIFLPYEERLLVAVFVRDSKADLATREAVIARIARAAYKAFLAESAK
jgi:beta-lactamase class A